MNARKAKSIRRGLKDRGIDARHAEYVSDVPGWRLKSTGRTNADGTPEVVRREVPGTIRLKHLCGRKLYKNAKRAA